MKNLVLKVCFTGLIVFALSGPVSLAQEPLKVGDRAPDFEAETFDGQTVKLSDRFGESGHPTILLFSRASW